jgi:molybdopterin-guanine dinucleotide biosynthesis protein A
MNSSAIVLAGGSSERFGKEKGLVQLANKPLVGHVLDVVEEVADEKIVVVSSPDQSERYAKIVGLDVRVVIDKGNIHGPLVGALAGFEVAHSECSLLLACDTPLVSREVLSLLLELCMDRNAAIPRWPNGYSEPLQAAYRTKPAFDAAERALKEGRMKVQCMVDEMTGVRYVSTLVIQQLDPTLKTFLNVNTALDFRKAEGLLMAGKALSGRRTRMQK